MIWKHPNFFSVLVASLALIVSITSSIMSYQLNQRTLATSIKPALVFQYSDTQGWALKNIGNGPALDVMVAHKQKENSDWFQPVRVPELMSGGDVIPNWLSQTKIYALGATYKDVHGRKYTTITAGDVTTIESGWQFKRDRSNL